MSSIRCPSGSSMNAMVSLASPFGVTGKARNAHAVPNERVDCRVQVLHAKRDVPEYAEYRAARAR